MEDLSRGSKITIYWTDATQEMEKWHDSDYVPEMEKFESTGYFVRQDDESITIAQTISTGRAWGDASLGGILNIPKPWVGAIETEEWVDDE